MLKENAVHGSFSALCGPELKASRPDGCLVMTVSIIETKNSFVSCLSFQMFAFLLIVAAAVVIVVIF